MSEEQMILENLNLVYFILKQMGLYKDKEEWFDVGIIGLIKGIKGYNPDYGLALSTFVCRCIKNEILIEIRKNDVIENLLNDLNDKERYILIHTYGLYGKEIYRQAKISEELNISQAQVSRILKKAIRKIKEVQNEN